MSTESTSKTLYVPPAAGSWGRQFILDKGRLVPTPQAWMDQIGPLESPRHLSPGWRNDLYVLMIETVARLYPGRHVFVDHRIPRAIGNSQFVFTRPDSSESLVIEDHHLIGVWNQTPGGQNAVVADVARRLKETFGE